MTKGIRRGILYVLILAFLVLGSGAVFYAQGWRMDVSGGRFMVDKVGGIYVQILPDDAALTLNGKPVRRGARIFERGTLINNLFPSSYRLRIHKDGYSDWSAVMPVMPAFVTSHPHIVLAPRRGEMVTSTAVQGMRSFGDELYAVSAAGSIFRGGSRLAGKRILAGSDDGRRVVTFDPSSGTFFMYDLGTATSTSFGRLFPRSAFPARLASTTAFEFVPQNDNLLVLRSSSTVRLADAGLGTVTLVAQGQGLSAGAAAPTRIAWAAFEPAAGHSVISFYDLLAGALLRDASIIPGRTIDLEFVNNNTLLALQNDGVMYSVAPGGGAQERLAEEVSAFALSPDQSALAVVKPDGMHIIFQKTGGRYNFLAIPEPRTVRRVAWYKDRSHLFVGYPDRTVFLDLQDATLANMAEVSPGGDFAYLSGPNQFYGLFEGVLMRFQFPG